MTGSIEMSAPRVPESSVNLLRCQQSLSPLELRDDGLFSPASKITYPIKDGLVFMGYDQARDAYFQTVMQEEKEHQTSAEFFDRDAQYLSVSAKATAAVMRALDRIQAVRPGARGIEVGAGSGWVSYMFAKQGYDMWICELEPNSLAISHLYDHPNLGPGKRIVSDATLLPFADATFDFVICKEFAHHVADKYAMFSEANRVLRPGGTLVLLEPVVSLASIIYYARYPDPHTDHVIVRLGKYLGDLRRAGFEIRARGPYSYRRSEGRLAFVRNWRERTDARLARGELRHTWWDDVMSYIVGGSLVVVAVKRESAPATPRPKIRVVDPKSLTITATDREIYRPFLQIIADSSSTST
jgi:ubiquinone/menaquinone biosynthesis C-methylase UbiE